MKALGRHIIAELSECNPETLRSLTKVKRLMVEAAERANAHIREIKFHRFSPEGISGVIVIAESHLSIHTWPEYGYAAVDIYTCGDTTHPEKACEYLAMAFEAQKTLLTVIKRGIETLTGNYSHRVDSSYDITAYEPALPMSKAV